MATSELSIPPPPDGFQIEAAIPPPPDGFQVEHVAVPEADHADKISLTGHGANNRAVGVNFLRGIPVAGAYADKAAAALNAAAQPLLETGLSHAPSFGQRYSENEKRIGASADKFATEHPIEAGIDQFAGGTAAFAPVGASAGAARALGLTGPTLRGMVARGVQSGALIGGADALARGQDVGTGAGIGAVTGGAIPVAGRAIGAGYGAVKNALAPTVRNAAETEIAGVKVPRWGSQNENASQIERQVSGDTEQQALTGALGEEAQKTALAAEKARADATQQAQQNFADQLAPATDPRLGAQPGTAATPHAAGDQVITDLAQQHNDQVQRQALGNVANEAEAFQSRGGLAPGAPAPALDASQTAIASIQAAARRAAEARTAAYRHVSDLGGTFDANRLQSISPDLEAALNRGPGESRVRVNPNTPQTRGALDAINEELGPGARLPRPEIPGAGGLGPAPAAPGGGPAPDLAASQLQSDIEALRAQYGDSVADAYARQHAPQQSAPAAGGGIMEPHTVSAADGSQIKVTPRVVEADSVRTSADPGYDASLQPRDRSRAASGAQVNDIANNLNPERLGRSAEADRGAPIVGPDGMVESGNGRVAAIRQAHEQAGQSSAAYRQWLESQGVDTSGFKKPLLVRERSTPLDPQQRQAFTVAANQGATLTMSAPERALSDAKLIGQGSLGLIRDPANLTGAGNRDFVRQFVAQLPASERGAMVDANGHLSQEGATRIRNAVLAKAYGDSPILTRIAEATHDDVRSISHALVQSAPEWAALREAAASGAMPAELDISKDLLDAVQRTAQLRSKGGSLESAMSQADAFDRQSPASEQIMKLFYDADGRRAAPASKISEALRYYAQQAGKVEAGPGLFSDAPKVSADQILKLAAHKVQAPTEIAADVLKPAAPAAPPRPPQAPPPIVAAPRPVEATDIEEVRKMLVPMMRDARNAARAPGGSAQDARGMRRLMDEFDAHIRNVVKNGGFTGDGEEYLRRQEAARQLHARFRSGFSNRGGGDVVGPFMEKVVGKVPGQSMDPKDFAAGVFGGQNGTGGGQQMNRMQHLMGIFGRDSAEATQLKQGLLSHVLDGTEGGGALAPEKAAANLRELMAGKGRGLAQVTFTQEEIQRGLQHADLLDRIGTATANKPTAVQQAIMKMSGALGDEPPTSRAVVSKFFSGNQPTEMQNQLARSLKGLVSPETWDALRQAKFLSLVRKPEGVTEWGPRQLSNRLGQFLDDPLAKTLYSDKELQVLRMIQQEHERQVPLPRTVNHSGTAPMMTKIAKSAAKNMFALLGMATHGPTGIIVGHGADKAMSFVGNQRNARKAADAFLGKATKPAYNTSPNFERARGILSRAALPLEAQNGQPQR